MKCEIYNSEVESGNCEFCSFDCERRNQMIAKICSTINERVKEEFSRQFFG